MVSGGALTTILDPYKHWLREVNAPINTHNYV